VQALPSDEIHVWVVDVHAPTARSDALSPDERRHADAYRRDEDRRRYVAARQALREALATYAGVAPAEVAFSTRCARCGSADHGKPALASPDGTHLRFSASRSGEVALVALARGREIGVDVERVDPAFDHREVASRFFAPSERVGLDAEAFFAAWTRKEALLKLSGLGLAGDLAADAPPGAWVVPLDAGAGYAAALAAEGTPCRVLVRPWPGPP
jgi:4'-phosphopantetheinyl transferase